MTVGARRAALDAWMVEIDRVLAEEAGPLAELIAAVKGYGLRDPVAVPEPGDTHDR